MATADVMAAGSERRLPWRVAVVAGAGAGTLMVLYDALFGPEGVAHWSGWQWVRFLALTAVIAFISVRYFDRYVGRWMGRREGPARDIEVQFRGWLVRAPAAAVIPFLGAAAAEVVQVLFFEQGSLVGRAALWVAAFLMSTVITFYLVRGAGQRPPQAMRSGAMSGAAMGAAFALLLAVLNTFSGATGSGVALIAIVNAAEWAFIGLAAGYAVDRGGRWVELFGWRWAERPTVRVFVALVATAFIAAIVLAVLQMPAWAALPRELFRRLGWGLALILFSAADGALDVRRGLPA